MIKWLMCLFAVYKKILGSCKWQIVPLLMMKLVKKSFIHLSKSCLLHCWVFNFIYWTGRFNKQLFKTGIVALWIPTMSMLSIFTIKMETLKLPKSLAKASWAPPGGGLQYSSWTLPLLWYQRRHGKHLQVHPKYFPGVWDLLARHWLFRFSVIWSVWF